MQGGLQIFKVTALHAMIYMTGKDVECARCDSPKDRRCGLSKSPSSSGTDLQPIERLSDFADDS